MFVGVIPNAILNSLAVAFATVEDAALLDVALTVVVTIKTVSASLARVAISIVKVFANQNAPIASPRTAAVPARVRVSVGVADERGYITANSIIRPPEAAIIFA